MPKPTDNVIELGDLVRLRKLLRQKEQIEIAVPHTRKGKKRPQHVIAYRYTGCTTKERIAVVPLPVLTKLCEEFGWEFAWRARQELLQISRGVLHHYGHALPEVPLTYTDRWGQSWIHSGNRWEPAPAR